jgi:hypothetical protein
MALCEYFELPMESYSLITVKQEFTKNRSLLASLNEWIDNTIKDLGYLSKLRAMEEDRDPANADFHIVPISGLILGTFVRYENELKTVLEVWGGKKATDTPSVSVHISTPLNVGDISNPLAASSAAVINDGVTIVFNDLKSGGKNGAITLDAGSGGVISSSSSTSSEGKFHSISLTAKATKQLLHQLER